MRKQKRLDFLVYHFLRCLKRFSQIHQTHETSPSKWCLLKFCLLKWGVMWIKLLRPATKLNRFQAQAHHDLGYVFAGLTLEDYGPIFLKPTESSTFHTKSHAIDSLEKPSMLGSRFHEHNWAEHFMVGVNGRHANIWRNMTSTHLFW